jgi:hypothetical protein
MPRPKKIRIAGVDAEVRGDGSVALLDEPTPERPREPIAPSRLSTPAIFRYPLPETNYVVYRGRQRSYQLSVRGRELCTSPNPPAPTEYDLESVERLRLYERRTGHIKRTIDFRSGEFMDEGRTLYVWGLEGDITQQTREGFAWQEVRLVPHLVWFLLDNEQAVQRGEESRWEVVMTPEMGRKVLSVIQKRTAAEQRIEALAAGFTVHV